MQTKKERKSKQTKNSKNKQIMVNNITNNNGETSESRGGAHTGFSERIHTILD